MTEPLLRTAHWTVTVADPPLPGAVHHWQLTPTCDTTATGLLDLSDEVLDDLLTALRRLRDEHGLPGYTWAVRHGETAVHFVAGGKATLELTPGRVA